nr:hypothetical protein [Tanacetum cinerariifolium]
MGRDTVQLETDVSTIFQEYLLEFTSEYGISEALHPKLPRPEDRIVYFLEGKNTYSPKAVRILDTHRTPIQKQPEALLCLVGLSRRYYLEDEVYPTFLHDDDRVDWARRPGNRGPRGAAPENVTTMGGAPEAGPTKRVAATDPPAVKERHKRGHNGVDTNAPPKVLRRDHADPRPTGSTRRGKSLTAIELGMGSTRPTHAPQGAPVDVSDPDPLSFSDPQSRPSANVA